MSDRTWCSSRDIQLGFHWWRDAGKNIDIVFIFSEIIIDCTDVVGREVFIEVLYDSIPPFVVVEYNVTVKGDNCKVFSEEG